MVMAVQVNAVFEGGGVKAIALIGAVSAAQQRGIRFNRVAGTSSGSIVASLLAAGYNASEMKTIITETPFKSFLQTSGLYRTKYIGPFFRLMIKKGLYPGDILEKWVSDKLEDKGIRTFADLPQNKLKIIASDISQGKLLVLPDDIEQYGIDPHRLEVSRAIRMSTSIPYFFDPVVLKRAPTRYRREKPSINKFFIVDGAMLSNFPLWIFDQPMRENKTTERTIPTVGFQLVGKNENVPRQIRGPITMFTALFATMMEAHDERYIENENRFRTIKIPTLGCRTTQFDLSAEMSEKLFASGVNAAIKYFDKWTYNGYMDQYKQWVIKK
jgi:NTE family protein